ncbi:MAG: hypothetical protein M3310_02640, partial [Actinomycetota bacterium]|nr:hypothetical protein [Actinomycetota bacterium]
MSAFGVQAAAGLASISVIVIVLSVSARSVAIRGVRLTVLDVAAVAAASLVAAAFATSGDDGAAGAPVLVLLLPVLIAFVGAVVAARVLGPFLRLAERVAPRARMAGRLALLSLVRNPGPATVTVVFLVVAAGLALFAGTYRSTLDANHRDAASYVSPLDYVVRSDPARTRAYGRPGSLAAPYRRFNGVTIVRRRGEIPTLNRREQLTVLGLPPPALSRLRWRDDYADLAAAKLADAVAFTGDAKLRGVAVPVGTTEIAFPLEVDGDPIHIVANFLRGDGTFVPAELRERRAGERSAQLPRGVAGGKLVALTFEFPPARAFTAAHRATGTRAAPDVFVRGALELGAPIARGRAFARPLDIDYRRWVGADRSPAGSTPARLRLRYFLTQERIFRIRPQQPT